MLPLDTASVSECVQSLVPSGRAKDIIAPLLSFLPSLISAECSALQLPRVLTNEAQLLSFLAVNACLAVMAFSILFVTLKALVGLLITGVAATAVTAGSALLRNLRTVVHLLFQVNGVGELLSSCALPSSKAFAAASHTPSVVHFRTPRLFAQSMSALLTYPSTCCGQRARALPPPTHIRLL